MKNDKINFTPLIADIALLFVIFFIAVIILQQLILQDTEHTFNLQSDTFFPQLEYKLDSVSKLLLEETLYSFMNKENIIDKFNTNRLEKIIVTGYADTTKPSNNLNYDNRKLSFLRAKTVCNIFTKLAKDSFNFNKNQVKIFQSKLLPAGYGDLNPLVIGKDIEKIKLDVYDDQYEYRIKGKRYPDFGTQKEFIQWENNQNRRIEVKTIYK